MKTCCVWRVRELPMCSCVSLICEDVLRLESTRASDVFLRVADM